MIKGASMFSSSGIAEVYLKEAGIDIKVGSELLARRANLHRDLYPDCEMVVGDITIEDNYLKYKDLVVKNDCKFLIATPPCQGMSTLGKKDYHEDERNYLIYYVIRLMKEVSFDYILIENVPKFLNLYFPYNGKILSIENLLIEEFGEKFNVEAAVKNAQDYGVPQSRPRAIIKIYKKGLSWANPPTEEVINLSQAIGHLPSIESGQDSGIKWHFSKIHNEREILAMKHTASGFSAMKNEFYFPRKKDGTKIKGFHNTYKRMVWDKPSPARAMNSGSMGGHNNVHPGRLKKDGTYSDSRVLSLRELFIVSSLPADWDLPDWVSDTLIRQSIGEAVPPLFCKKIVEQIGE